MPMVLLLLDTQHYGILIAQIFFGLWLVPLGYLAYKSSGMFPKWLGVLLIVGGGLLPRGPARAVPGPRRRPNDPRLRRHPVSNRGDLDGPLPARDRCEDRQARRTASSPRSERSRTLTAVPLQVAAGCGVPNWFASSALHICLILARPYSVNVPVSSRRSSRLHVLSTWSITLVSSVE